MLMCRKSYAKGNKKMKSSIRKKGFTIIEVALFLAISGAILAAIIAGTSSITARRRYNDAVNDMAEFLRSAYSYTINVENTRYQTEESNDYCSISTMFDGTNYNETAYENDINDNYPGRTRCVIYGQLITFGELDEHGHVSEKINRYDIIGAVSNGDINPDPTGNTDEILNSLMEVGADVVTAHRINKDIHQCVAKPAGTTSVYTPQWESRAEFSSAYEPFDGRKIYKGAIMIARSPVSGTLHTYFYSEKGDLDKENTGTLEIHNWLSEHDEVEDCSVYKNEAGKFLRNAIASGKMIRGDRVNGDPDKPLPDGLSICVGSEDLFAVGGNRRGINIHMGGSTESAVELLTDSQAGEICKK